ncbi:hypothetical protein ABIA39_003923 [Nocardia sp. GAS34]|uniref:WXG100-like domain-containing protein n=1 Tax=unclassified Nocardia TaxID=2637762 RepID=UPI003D1DB2EC
MSLYLPPELRWLGWIAGGTWPDGDEDKAWNVSNAYRDTAEALRKLIPEIEDVKRTAVSAYPEGDGGDKIGALFDQMLTGDQSMESLAHFMDQISDATNDFGVSIQAAKLMTIVSLIALAIEIAWAWAFPPTAPAVEAAEEATTQFIMRRLEQQIQERILAKVLSVFGDKFANLSKGWIMKILEGALISGTLDAAVQVGQMAGGHRKSFDWNEFGGALAAGFGAPFGRAAANSINKFTTKLLGDKLSNPWIRAGNGMLVGIGSSPVFTGIGGLGGAMITGDWAGTLGNPAGWVGGAAHGGIVGGVRGYFGHNKFDNKSFEVDWKAPGDGAVHIPVRAGGAFDAGGLGPRGVRSGFDGDHIATQNQPGGSNEPRGGNRNFTVDDSSESDGKSGPQGTEQNPPRSTIPASSNDAYGTGESPNRAPDEVSHRNSGSNDDSSTNNSGTSKQPPSVMPSNNGGRSGDSSDSGQRDTPSPDRSKAGATYNGSGSSGSSSNRSSDSGGGRSESPASANSAGSEGRSSTSGGESPVRTSSANPSGDGRNSSAIGGTTGRSAGDAGDGRGGPPAARPAPGSDGSAPSDRSAISQAPKGGGQTPGSNITAGQSSPRPASGPGASANGSVQPPRSSAVSEVSSNGSSGPPRSSAVSEVSSNGSAQPRRPLDVNTGGAPPQRPPASDQGSDSGRSPGASDSGSGSQNSPGRRASMPEPDAGGTFPTRQRPPESNPGGLAPQRQQPEGDQPSARASVPQEQHSDPGGQRGHDAEPDGPGGWTLEGGQEHPNWERVDSGGVRITSPDGTEHWVDKRQNIFIGRPGDETWVMIRLDRSVEFVPNDGGAPVAPSGPRAGGSGRGQEFGFGRGDGTRYKVLSDNSVQTTSLDNWTTIVKRNGGAELRSPWDERTQFEPDGTTIHTRPGDPAIVTTPDNTVHIVPNDKAGRERNADGNLVVTSPDGTEHVIGEDGTILVGRPGDPQLMKVESDHSIAFVGPDGAGPSDHPETTVGKGTGVQSPTFTRADRVSHTVLDDGSVRTKSPDDWTTTVRSNRATEFISPTGDRIVFKADDTVVESGPGRPTVTIGPDRTTQTTEPNGAVTVEDPDGTKHVVFDSTDTQGGGRTEHPDHTVIHYDLSDTAKSGSGGRLGGLGPDGPRRPGVVQMDRPDGIGFESSPNGIKVFDGDGTTYERGSGGSVRITEPNGHTETRPMTEPIELSNGAQLEKAPGGFRVVHEDDSVSEIGPRGARFTDTEGVIRGTRTNGTAFVERPDGSLREVRGDGAVRVTESDGTAWGSRGDGTTWNVDDENKVHVSDSDGTVAPPADPKSPYVDGARLTATNKPRHRNVNDPLTGGYEAPIAPDTEEWIPPGDENGPPDQNESGPPDQDQWGPPDQNQWGPDQNEWGPPDPGYWGPPNSGPDNGDSSNSDSYDHNQDSQGPGGNGNGQDTSGSGQGGNSGGSGRGGDSGGIDRGDNSGPGGNPGGAGRDGSPGGAGHGGNSGRDGSSGGADRGGNSGGHDGSPGRSGHAGGNSGDSGNRGGSGGAHGSPGNDRQAPPEHRQSPPPPRLDPAALSRMLQNLHSADGMAPPADTGGSSSPNGGVGGGGTNGLGASSPDYWRLGSGNGLSSSTPETGGGSGSAVPNGVSSPSQRSATGGGNGSAEPDLSALRGALDRVGAQGSDDLGQGASDQAGSPNHPGTGSSLNSSQDPAAQGGQDSASQDGMGNQDQPGTPGHAGDSARPGAPQNSDGQQLPGRQTDPNATGGQNNSSSAASGGQPGTDTHTGTPGSGDRPGAPDSANPSDGTGAGDHSGTAGSGDRSGAAGSGDQDAAPGTGSHPGTTQHPGATRNPDHSPDHSRVPEQQGNSGSNADGTDPSMPGRMPASPMQDGHQPPGSASPGGAPSSAGAPPSADAAEGKKKQSRRPRKKSDKPRKKPKVVLTFSPFETPEHRAGVDDSTDVPFTLGASASATEPVIEKRPTTKTTRSTTDG